MPDEALGVENGLDEYEPPAIVSLGSFGELTLGVPDDGSATPSDRSLKQDIEVVPSALERVRTIGTSAR